MEKNPIKTTLTLTAGLAGAAGLAAIATTPNATHAATTTGTVTYKDGATTVWGSPEFDTQSVKRYVVYNQSVNILDQKTVDGATWYKIGENEWIPALYLKSGDDTKTADEKTNDNIDLSLSYTKSAVTVWADPSYANPTGDYLTTDDTNITAVSKETVNGEVWYKLSNGGYVPARYAGTASEVAAAQAAAAQTSTTTTTQAAQATTAQQSTAASQSTDSTTTTSAAKTDTTATTTKLKVNYPAGPVTVWQDTSYAQATGTYLDNGSIVSAVASTTVNGEAWYQLSNGGYVPARFVTTNLNTPTTTKKAATTTAASTTTTQQAPASTQSTTPAKPATPAVQTTTMKVVYAGGVVTVWNSASTASGAASYLSNGQKVTVTGSKVAGADGLSYYKLSDGGYVPAQYVTTNLNQSVATKAATPAKATTTTRKASTYVAPKRTTTTTRRTTTVAKTPTYNTSSSASRSAKVQAVISMARAQIGTPYVWGGKTTSGFDCSGLMYYVFLHAAGKNIGGWTVPQESSGYRVSVSNLQAGDLVFWGSAGSTYHVGLYIGGGQYIHAPQPGQTVTTASISSYFQPSFGVHVNM
ncbi:C40 family peptidase [Lacticaseibacillus nasuensis]|uniref:NlpC P60 family protein n=1 Tax=Lacticaseibacillus nasuensis JCM 17158 TaxID=1291734 RepID=A0A0R1JZA1_9LACO|nr:C40 family peptidase [Lacticaseibacillus nasuensis]KRK74073.1 nlpC P60 family protein [Lacticaseibacillus nasuensis JCM 17158]